MADRSKIEWTDATWNPILARRRDTGKVGFHCEHASEGCRNCYAETFNGRALPARGTGLAYKPGHRADVEIFADEKTLLQPLRWRKPRTIFVGSMTDLFAEFVADAMIDPVFAVMALCPQHTFQVLTKRSRRMRAYVSNLTNRDDLVARSLHSFDPSVQDIRRRVRLPLPNVWLGTSCEDQAAADERVPELLATPAAVRFVSAEPLLGPINFRTIDLDDWHEVLPLGSAYLGDGQNEIGLPKLDWIIVGGESGPHARPMHPRWARDIRDQCAAAGVAFLFKQWGEYGPCELQPPGTAPTSVVTSAGRHLIGRAVLDQAADDEAEIIARFGKRRAGRLLDGREHNGRPEDAHVG